MSWFAVYTEPLKEHFASKMLSFFGFRDNRVFFPHIPEWQGLGTRYSHLVRRAYYPRYVFVDCIHDDAISELGGIWLIPGVVGVVKGTSRMPFRIPEKALEPVFAISDGDGAVHIQTAPRSKYGALKGHRVKIVEGNPLWGLVATIAEVDELRASVVIKMLGAEREVSVPVDFVGEPLSEGNNLGVGSSDARFMGCA